MTTQDPAPDNRRAAQRTAVEGNSSLVQRTVLLAPGQIRQHKCRITDTSATGYRIVLLSPRQDAGSQFSRSQELVLEHVEGWTRTVSVRWIHGNQLGLQILNPVTKVILTDDHGKPQAHECRLLGAHNELYRVELAEAPVMFGTFSLELPNGERVPVRMRWKHEDEICLQLTGNRWKRL